MTTLADLITGYTRTPSATVRLDGRRWYNILSLSRAQAFGSGVSGGSVLGRNPPVTPTVGMAISWTWGYNGLEVAGFTGEVTDVLDSSYPDRWKLEVKDVLHRAERVNQVIQTSPLNNIAASAAVEYILSTYGGISANRLAIPTLAASGSEWSGAEWVLGVLTPVQWGDPESDGGGTTALRAALDICEVLGYWLYCDASGVIRAKQMERRPASQAFRTFQRGVDLLVQGAPERQASADGIRNRVVVRGANTGVDGAQLVDAYQTSHPLLPSGVYQTLEYSSSLIEYINPSEAGAASAGSVARRILANWSRTPDVLRVRIKADPRLSVGATVGVIDSGVRLSTAKNYFIYSLETSLNLDTGAFDQSLVLDGGIGNSGYTTIPNPDASFSWRLVAETIDGDAIVEVFLDGSGSVSLTQGEIVDWDWSTTATPYTGTSSTATGERAVLIFLASEGSAEITLTVTDTTSKTGSVTQTVDLTGADTRPPMRHGLSVAFGSAWAVSTDGGATWRDETTNGAAIAVPPIGAGVDDRASGTAGTYGLLATRGASGTALRRTLDGLQTASTNLASIGTVIRCLWVNEANPARVWAGAGDTVYRSTDGGATFTAMAKPAAGTNINWIIEDPAVDNSVFVACGADLYNTTDPTAGWDVLYAGPSGATARQFVRSRDGQVTWVAYTGTFTDSPLQRVEDGSFVSFPGDTSEIRALALSHDASVLAGTIYAVDSHDPPRLFSASAITGLSVVESTNTLPSGSTAQHMLCAPEQDILFIADFDSVASGTGAVRKWIPAGDHLFLLREGASGWQAHMLGFAGQTPGDGEFLFATGGLAPPSPGGVYHIVDGVATLRNSGLSSGTDWLGVVADPLNPDRWIVWSATTAYLTSNAGASWTAITGDIFDGLAYTNTIIDVAFSPTTSGEWTIAGGSHDNFALQDYGTLARGSGTAVSSSHHWLGAGFATDGDTNYPTAIAYGTDGDVVMATAHAAGSIDGQLRLVAPGAIADTGTLISTPARTFLRIDRYPGVATKLASAPYADTIGELWYSADYATAPSAVLTGGSWDSNAASACAPHGVYVGGTDGLYQIPSADAASASVIGAAGKAILFVRSDRQTQSLIAATYYDSGGGSYVVTTDGLSVSAALLLPGNLGGALRNLARIFEVIVRTA